ncbi:MAG: HD domain-containing protein [Spirochaetales bacterium]|nr:HD domain-containing protein [Spirochaetales bacterium]
MKEVPVVELREDMYFDAPVYLDERYVLLSPETRVTAELLERLRRWGFPHVYTDGSAVEAPSYLAGSGAKASSALLDLDIRERKKLEQARKLYYAAIHFVVDAFTRFREDNRIDPGLVTERVKQLIDEVKNNKDGILRLPQFPHPAENYLYQHSVNTTLLSLAVGDALKLPPHRLIELGMCALLHDIGMLKLPDAVYMNARSLTPQETKMIQAHTTLGYRILKGFSLSDDIALSAFEHHERPDGTGYPRGLAGEKINLYARIVSACCSYDAMTGKRTYRRAVTGHQALLELLKGRGSRYDEKIVRTLVYCLSLYPLGHLVRLEDGSLARVVQTNPESPKSPFVDVLIDASGTRVEEPAIVSTGGEGSPTITQCLSLQEADSLGLS